METGWFRIVRTVQHGVCVCGVRTAVLQHISSDGRRGLDTEVSQVCLQIPHTVTIIYYQLSLDTTLGLQKTVVFDLFAVQLWTL